MLRWSGLLMGVAALAAAGCTDRSSPAPANPASTLAAAPQTPDRQPAAVPAPSSPTAAEGPTVTGQEGQNYSVSAEGGLRIVGSETQYHILLPTDVLFDFDQANLRTEAAPLLAQLREHFRTHRADQVHVVGHTDAVGQDQYNFRLSLRRATAVCNWLRRETSLRTTNCIGRGEQEPVAPNTNPDGSDNPLNRQLNRRVVINVVAYPDVQQQLDEGRQAGQAARAAIEESRRSRQ